MKKFLFLFIITINAPFVFAQNKWVGIEALRINKIAHNSYPSHRLNSSLHYGAGISLENQDEKFRYITKFRLERHLFEIKPNCFDCIQVVGSYWGGEVLLGIHRRYLNKKIQWTWGINLTGSSGRNDITEYSGWGKGRGEMEPFYASQIMIQPKVGASAKIGAKYRVNIDCAYAFGWQLQDYSSDDLGLSFNPMLSPSLTFLRSIPIRE